MKTNQKGFSIIEVIVVIVVVGLIGAVGWLVHNNRNKTGSKVTASTSKTSTAIQTKTTQKADSTPKSSVVKLYELDMQFTLPANTLTDFKYVAANVDYNDPGNNNLGVYPTAYLGSQQLDKLGCPTTGVMGNSPPFGYLTKTTGQYPANPTADNATGTLLKQYPDFYISYRSSGSPCFDDDAKNQIVATQNKQLHDALKSLEPIK